MYSISRDINECDKIIAIDKYGFVCLDDCENELDDEELVKFKNLTNGMKLLDPDSKKNKTREAINIYGVAGTGKTSWVRDFLWANQEAGLLDEYTIYLITTNTEPDDILKGLNIKMLSIDEEKAKSLYNSISETTFKDSIVIFDDWESDNYSITQFIRMVRNKLFLKARKHNTHILNIMHKAMDNQNSTTPNLESTGGVFFIRGENKHNDKVLLNYFNFSTKRLRQVKSLKNNSPWVYVNKSYPQYILSSNHIELI